MDVGVMLADMAHELRDLVTVIPGSIGFVPMSEVGPDLKVIRIDGRLPGDEGYPLN